MLPAAGLPEPCIHVARQPILDKRHQVYAYELLFRDGMASAMPSVEGNLATQSLLLNTYAEIGIDRIAGNQRVFVNFTEATLIAQLPLLFPRDRLVIEILEDVEPTEELVAACKSLRSQGYSFALDDFVYDERFDPLIDIADIIKLDFLSCSAPEIAAVACKMKERSKILLAEKVETPEQHRLALALGFSLFQGYYFNRPEIISGTSIKSQKLNLIQILGEISTDDYDVGAIEGLLARDVALSYKLLRYINSASMRGIHEVKSIRQAITRLGRTEFRNFVALVLTADMGSDKPLELTRCALIRARFLEALAPSRSRQAEFFLLGLCSLMDALLDRDMEQLVNDLPLSEHMRDALVKKHPFADYLALSAAYEHGEWERVSCLINALGLNEELAMQNYNDAIAWADDLPIGA